MLKQILLLLMFLKVYVTDCKLIYQSFQMGEFSVNCRMDDFLGTAASIPCKQYSYFLVTNVPYSIPNPTQLYGQIFNAQPMVNGELCNVIDNIPEWYCTTLLIDFAANNTQHTMDYLIDIGNPVDVICANINPNIDSVSDGYLYQCIQTSTGILLTNEGHWPDGIYLVKYGGILPAIEYDSNSTFAGPPIRFVCGDNECTKFSDFLYYYTKCTNDVSTYASSGFTVKYEMFPTFCPALNIPGSPFINGSINKCDVNQLLIQPNYTSSGTSVGVTSLTILNSGSNLGVSITSSVINFPAGYGGTGFSYQYTTNSGGQLTSVTIETGIDGTIGGYGYTTSPPPITISSAIVCTIGNCPCSNPTFSKSVDTCYCSNACFNAYSFYDGFNCATSTCQCNCQFADSAYGNWWASCTNGVSASDPGNYLAGDCICPDINTTPCICDQCPCTYGGNAGSKTLISHVDYYTCPGSAGTNGVILIGLGIVSSRTLTGYMGTQSVILPSTGPAVFPKTDSTCKLGRSTFGPSNTLIDKFLTQPIQTPSVSTTLTYIPLQTHISVDPTNSAGFIQEASNHYVISKPLYCPNADSFQELYRLLSHGVLNYNFSIIGSATVDAHYNDPGYATYWIQNGPFRNYFEYTDSDLTIPSGAVHIPPENLYTNNVFWSRMNKIDCSCLNAGSTSSGYYYSNGECRPQSYYCPPGHCSCVQQTTLQPIISQNYPIVNTDHICGTYASPQCVSTSRYRRPGTFLMYGRVQINNGGTCTCTGSQAIEVALGFVADTSGTYAVDLFLNQLCTSSQTAIISSGRIYLWNGGFSPGPYEDYFSFPSQMGPIEFVTPGPIGVTISAGGINPTCTGFDINVLFGYDYSTALTPWTTIQSNGILNPYSTATENYCFAGCQFRKQYIATQEWVTNTICTCTPNTGWIGSNCATCDATVPWFPNPNIDPTSKCDTTCRSPDGSILGTAACKNNGTCIYNSIANTASCQCASGYSGAYCQFRSSLSVVCNNNLNYNVLFNFSCVIAIIGTNIPLLADYYCSLPITLFSLPSPGLTYTLPVSITSQLVNLSPIGITNTTYLYLNPIISSTQICAAIFNSIDPTQNIICPIPFNRLTSVTNNNDPWCYLNSNFRLFNYYQTETVCYSLSAPYPCIPSQRYTYAWCHSVLPVVYDKLACLLQLTSYPNIDFFFSYNNTITFNSLTTYSLSNLLIAQCINNQIACPGNIVYTTNACGTIFINNPNSTVCSNHGTCVFLSGSSYNCVCEPGYVQPNCGPNACGTNILNNPFSPICTFSGTCISSTSSSYTCSCYSGLLGPNCIPVAQLVVMGPGGHGGPNPGSEATAGGGGSGQYIYNSSFVLSLPSYTVTVGTPGNPTSFGNVVATWGLDATSNGNGCGGAGGDGSAGGCTNDGNDGGGGGGILSAGGQGDSGNGGVGGAGITNPITGTIIGGGGGGASAFFAVSPGGGAGGAGGADLHHSVNGGIGAGGGGVSWYYYPSDTGGLGGNGTVIISWVTSQVTYFATGGGTITTNGPNTIATFLSSGILFKSTVQLVVMGPGGHGSALPGSLAQLAGGGGSGQYIYFSNYALLSDTYTVTVGTPGNPTSFGSVVAAWGLDGTNSGPGGAGGDGSAGGNGCSGTFDAGGGGGGISGVGGDASCNSNSGFGGAGGPGVTNPITGTVLGGGGGGTTYAQDFIFAPAAPGGGNGGNGGYSGAPSTNGGIGAGGGGASWYYQPSDIGGLGGNGIVIVSWITSKVTLITTGATITTNGLNTIATFLTSGTLRIGILQNTNGCGTDFINNPDSIICANHGTCVSSSSNYTCICDSGYVGSNCINSTCGTSMINNNLENPLCSNVGTCTATSSFNFTCTCDIGYLGKYCEIIICQQNLLNNKLIGTGSGSIDSRIFGPGGGQGTSVAISADAQTLAIGAPGDNNDIGAVWIYNWNKTTSTWIQYSTKLVGSGYGSDYPLQGFSVALNANGTTLAVGAPFDDAPSYGTPSSVIPGATFIWVFDPIAKVWNQQGSKLFGTGTSAQFGDNQGFSVSLSSDGNTLAVGGPAVSAGNTRYSYLNYVFPGMGAAWIFVRDVVTQTWSQQGSYLQSGVLFQVYAQGYSISLSGDGNTLAVGQSGTSIIGGAYIYVRNITTNIWSRQGGKLIGNDVIAGPEYNQGIAVSLSENGNIVAIGNPIDNNAIGATSIFVRNNTGGWNQFGSKLVGTGNVDAAAAQGVFLSFSGNNILAIGGPGWGAGNNDGHSPWMNPGTGAVWIFVLNGTKWTQQGSELIGPGSIGSASQGSSVALSAVKNINGSLSIILVSGGQTDNSNIGATWVAQINSCGVYNFTT